MDRVLDITRERGYNTQFPQFCKIILRLEDCLHLNVRMLEVPKLFSYDGQGKTYGRVFLNFSDSLP